MDTNILWEFYMQAYIQFPCSGSGGLTKALDTTAVYWYNKTVPADGGFAINDKMFWMWGEPVVVTSI